MSEMTKYSNLDPNLAYSWSRAKYTIRLMFGCWDYRLVKVVEIKTNMRGFDVAEAAVATMMEELWGDSDRCPSISLYNIDGDILECDDDEDKGEEWLKELLIGYEIISMEPAGRIGDD